MLVPLLLLVALFAVLVLLAHHQRLRTEVPGPSPLPFVGNAWLLRNTEICFQSLCKLKEYYGNVFRVYVGNMLYVFIWEPQDIQKVLFNSHITERDPYYCYVTGQMIGDGLLTSRGEKWKKNRKILAPTFHHQVINQFLHTFNKQASVLADSLVDHCAEDIDIYPLVCVSTLEMICQSAMGYSFNASGKEDDKKLKLNIGGMIARLIHLLEERISRPWLAANWLYSLTSRGREQKTMLNQETPERGIVCRQSPHQGNVSDRIRENQSTCSQGYQMLTAVMSRAIGDPLIEDRSAYSSGVCLIAGREILSRVLHGLADGIITRKMESGQIFQRSNEEPLRSAFMDTMLREGGETLLPKSEIRDESLTLIGAGFETSAKSLCFTLCLLAHHKDWQAAVHQELDDIFLRGEDNERPLTSEDVADLRILDCVIKESLRLFPVAPFLPRLLPCDITLGPNKLAVPKGASVFVLPYFTHRMSEVYSNPEVFDPTRFFPANSDERNSYNYIPFGAGPRNCIGTRYAMMQMKVILTWILRRYHIVTATSREELEKLEFSITMKPVNGFKVQLQRRHL